MRFLYLMSYRPRQQQTADLSSHNTQNLCRRFRNFRPLPKIPSRFLLSSVSATFVIHDFCSSQKAGAAILRYVALHEYIICGDERMRPMEHISRERSEGLVAHNFRGMFHRYAIPWYKNYSISFKPEVYSPSPPQPLFRPQRPISSVPHASLTHY